MGVSVSVAVLVGVMVGGTRQMEEFETATVDPGPIEGKVIEIMPQVAR